MGGWDGMTSDHVQFFDEELKVEVVACTLSGKIILTDERYDYCPHCGKKLDEHEGER